jgi:hypothetical protein
MSNKKGLKVGSENGQAGGTMISSSSMTTFDLGMLVETVVEGILAGHGYRAQISRTSGGEELLFARRRSRLTPSGVHNDVSVSSVIGLALSNFPFPPKINRLQKPPQTGCWLRHQMTGCFRYRKTQLLAVSISNWSLEADLDQFIRQRAQIYQFRVCASLIANGYNAE